MDVVHMYEQSRRMVFMEPGTERLVVDRAAFNETVGTLMRKAQQDLEAEGLSLDEAVYSLELDMLYGGQVNLKRAASPRLEISNDTDAQAVYLAFESEFSEAFSPLVVNKPGGVFLDNFVLRVTVPMWKPEVREFPLGTPDASAARIGTRRVYWPDGDAWEQTAIYQFELLAPGNVISGPAVIEAELTTAVVPPRHKFSIDQHGLGILEPVTAPQPRRRVRALAASVA
jgi:N-methylhydantoinase A/acetophenone carboxylase